MTHSRLLVLVCNQQRFSMMNDGFHSDIVLEKKESDQQDATELRLSSQRPLHNPGPATNTIYRVEITIKL